MATVDPRTPVLVGAGAVHQRLDDPSGAEEAARLMRAAARAAAADAGAPGLLDRVVVPEGTWPYPDPGRLVGAPAGARTVVAQIGVLQQTFVCERIIVGEPIDHPPIDVALYDTYGRVGIAAHALKRLRRHRDIRYVAMFTLELLPELVEVARRSGATGFISKSLPAETIVDALVGVAASEVIVAEGESNGPALVELEWPGKDQGLSERESQVLVLASEGHTTAEIGEALYLGRETAKTHLSNCYGELGARNRAEAVRFVFDTGSLGRYRPTAEAFEEA